MASLPPGTVFAQGRYELQREINREYHSSGDCCSTSIQGAVARLLAQDGTSKRHAPILALLPVFSFVAATSSA